MSHYLENPVRAKSTGPLELRGNDLEFLRFECFSVLYQVPHLVTELKFPFMYRRNIIGPFTGNTNINTIVGPKWDRLSRLSACN